MGSGRRTQLPPGTKIEDGRIINPKPKPRDAAQKRRWATSHKVRVAKRVSVNGIGKNK